MTYAAAGVGFVDAALCALLAVFVLAIGEGRRPNRALSWLLVVEGSGQLFAALANLPEGGAMGLAAAATLPVAVALTPAFYLLVIRELDTPLGRALRSPAATAIVLASGALFAASVLVTRDVSLGSSTLGIAIELVTSLSLALGIAVGIWAVRLAPPASLRRKQAWWFVVAFGIRDALYIAYFARDIIVGAGASVTWNGELFDVALPFYATLLFVPLLTYAILSAQLFDIDVRIKIGVQRALVAGAFLLVFSAANEIAERLFSARFGTIVGIAAAALLTLAFHPLERVAARLTNAILPIRDPDERRFEIYRAAIESALESGGIDERERALLARLRQKLEIPAERAAAIERDLGVATA